MVAGALGQSAPPEAGRSLREMARAQLQARLDAHHGSRAELARQLGISERSLYRKLRALAPRE